MASHPQIAAGMTCTVHSSSETLRERQCRRAAAPPRSAKGLETATTSCFAFLQSRSKLPKLRGFSAYCRPSGNGSSTAPGTSKLLHGTNTPSIAITTIRGGGTSKSYQNTRMPMERYSPLHLRMGTCVFYWRTVLGLRPSPWRVRRYPARLVPCTCPPTPSSGRTISYSYFSFAQSSVYHCYNNASYFHSEARQPGCQRDAPAEGPQPRPGGAAY